MAIKEKDKATINAVMTRLHLQPEFNPKTGAVKSIFMADLEANRQKLEAAYRASDAEGKKELEDFVKIHVRRNVDNMQRTARRQKEAARKMKDGIIKKTMENKAKEIEQIAKDYRSMALNVQTGKRKGKKRTGLRLIEAYKEPPKVHTTSKEAVASEILESMKQIGIIAGVEKPAEPETITKTVKYKEGWESAGAEAEPPEQFISKPSKEIEKPKSEAAGGLADLYSIAPGTKDEIQKAMNELRNRFPDFADVFFGALDETRKARAKEYSDIYGKDAKKPANFGNSPDAILETLDTFSERMIENKQRGKAMPYDDIILDEVQKLAHNIRQLLGYNS